MIPIKGIVRGHAYNTEKDTLIKEDCYGKQGDPWFYCEGLFKDRLGRFYLAGRGGKLTKWADSEGIKPITEQQARAWLTKRV